MNNQARFLAAILMVALFFTFAVDASAQKRVRQKGMLQNTEGNPVGGATLTVTFIGDSAGVKEFTTKTKDDGSFILGRLYNGNWDIKITHPDYMDNQFNLPIRHATPVEDFILNMTAKDATGSMVGIKDGEEYEVSEEEEEMLDTLMEAKECYEDEEYDVAIELLEDFIEFDEKHVKAHLLLGDCYAETDLTDDAKEMYEHVIALDSKNGDAYVRLGNILVNQYNYNDAFPFYQKAAEFKGNDANVLFIAGEVANASNNYAEACKHFDKFIAIESDTTRTYSAAMTVGFIHLVDGDCDKAEKYFKVALQLNDSEKATLEAELENCRSSK